MKGTLANPKKYDASSANYSSTSSDPHFLSALLRSMVLGTPSFWIGAREVDTEDNWKWSDGSAVEGFNWFLTRTGRMPAGKNKDTRECMMLGYSSSSSQSSITQGLTDTKW